MGTNLFIVLHHRTTPLIDTHSLTQGGRTSRALDASLSLMSSWQKSTFEKRKLRFQTNILETTIKELLKFQDPQ